MTDTANYTALVAYIASVVPTVRCNDCNEICDVAPCHCGSFCSYTDEETPITLADVLLAVDKAIYDMGQAISFSVNETGRMSFGAYQSATWKLGKPLSGQDEDMINWLVPLFPISK